MVTVAPILLTAEEDVRTLGVQENNWSTMQRGQEDKVNSINNRVWQLRRTPARSGPLLPF